MAERSSKSANVSSADKKRETELKYLAKLQWVNTMRSTRLDQSRQLTQLKEHHDAEQAPIHVQREIEQLERSLIDNAMRTEMTLLRAVIDVSVKESAWARLQLSECGVDQWFRSIENLIDRMHALEIQTLHHSETAVKNANPKAAAEEADTKVEGGKPGPASKGKEKERD